MFKPRSATPVTTSLETLSLEQYELLSRAIDDNNIGEVESLLRDFKTSVDLEGQLSLLTVAAIYGYTDMARLLIARGASLVDMPDGGISPLFSAIDHDHVDTARLLITAGVDINARNPFYENETPLHWASWHGKVEMVNVLLTAGADINLVTKQGETPLQVAKNDEVAAAIRDHIANMQNKTSLSSVDSLFANSLTVNNEIKAPGASAS